MTTFKPNKMIVSLRTLLVPRLATIISINNEYKLNTNISAERTQYNLNQHCLNVEHTTEESEDFIKAVKNKKLNIEEIIKSEPIASKMITTILNEILECDIYKLEKYMISRTIYSCSKKFIARRILLISGENAYMKVMALRHEDDKYTSEYIDNFYPYNQNTIEQLFVYIDHNEYDSLSYEALKTNKPKHNQ